jgi:uncharacterized protein YgbK (DUF1537 family)
MRDLDAEAVVAEEDVADPRDEHSRASGRGLVLSRQRLDLSEREEEAMARLSTALPEVAAGIVLERHRQVEGPVEVLVDALDDGDLRTVGEACAQAPLITGGSGVARGLPANFRAAGLLEEPERGFEGLAGPGIVLAGSCSAATRRQVDVFRSRHPSLALEPDAVMTHRSTAADLVAFASEHRKETPIIYSTAAPEHVAETQERHGRDAVSSALEALFAEAAVRLAGDGVRRLVVAGGETSGAVVSALGLRALAIGPEIDPGVPALRTVEGPPLALALKSGNFGSPEFFEKALSVLEGA